jgi:glycosyltransferase involved in cell wall biosynthesis
MKRRLGARRVFWNHRGGSNDGGFGINRFLVKTILRNHPVFVANSDVGADFLRHTFSLTETRVHVIRNAFAVDFDDRPSVSALQKDASSRIRMLHVANVFGEKDVETVIRAMHILRSSAVVFHLHLVGHFPDPNVRKTIEELVTASDLTGVVTLHGGLNRDQLRTLLREADVGLLSSRSEGMPNSIMEYMHWGLPVVATDIPGIREVVGEENAPWLFKIGDAKQLSALLETLGRDQHLRCRLGAANRKRIAENYAADRILPDWKRLISE